jgi:hypothetical protein
LLFAFPCCCSYLTLFAAVFPAAAPLCLLLTLAKIKLDCLRLTAVQQRPVPLQLAGIGAWNRVLTVLVSCQERPATVCHWTSLLVLVDCCCMQHWAMAVCLTLCVLHFEKHIVVPQSD